MRLALDHHYAAVIATTLRTQGLDVVTAGERGWHELTDPALLARCVEEERALLTNNARDFAPLAREWAAAGDRHFGLVLTDDRRWPRSMDGTGRLIHALASLLLQHPADDGFVDRVPWL